ncbi:MAG: LLM class flavin-dependent oxidoreductase [Oscillospiraceae bacterium]|nr:LLM class flavin-dependent oxidoreductase [Oscillospiraceae bacterium]
MKMNTRNEIKAIIVREGMTMSEIVEKLAEQYGWSASVPNLSGKLRRGSLRYQEAVELADALGYDLVWQKRKERR